MKKNTIFLFNLLIFVLIFIPTARVIGASLYFSPSIGDYTVGNTFLIQAKINSGGISINATDGTLIFDPDKLQVVSIDKTGSIFSLWVQDPIYSNTLGTINFAGGKQSPGYVGASGVMINITFKAKISGTAKLIFAAGSILADDGKGTNVLSSLGEGSYSLLARSISPIPSTPQTPSTPIRTSKTPAAPEVFSSTHSKENNWYSNHDPEFTWDFPSDVTKVSVLLHEKPTGNPGSISDGEIEEKKYEEIENGTWYFHIKYGNSYGWGDITHRKVLIDTNPPDSFEITIENGGDPTNPTPILNFITKDSLSGVEYYEIKIGNEKLLITEEERKKEPFKLFPQFPGEYSIEVYAFDKAGNSNLATIKLEILPIETSVEITEIPNRINIDESLVIKGASDPKTTVKIYLQRGTEDLIVEKIQTDSAGKFIFTYNKVLPKGDYQVWARVEDERGASTNPTSKYFLKVDLPPFLRFGKIALDYFAIMITLIVLIVGAVAIIFYTWYRISVWKRRVRRETKEVTQSVSTAFRDLKEKVEEQVSKIDKKPGLTKREKEIKNELQSALDVSEKFINKEIKDIKKELD